MSKHLIDFATAFFHHTLARIPVSFLFLLSFCSHPDSSKEYLGPVDHTTPEVFSLVGDTLISNHNLIDFQIFTQFFKAKFSAKVAWTLVINGQKSGAVKSISGISLELDSTNTSWQGDSDSLIFFREGEKCEAMLTISGKARTYKTSFSISKTPVFNCVVMDDFESPNDESGFVEIYEDEEDSLQTARLLDSSESIQEKGSLRLSGFDSNSNYWIETVSSNNLNLKNLAKGQTSNTLYINFFAKGNAAGNTRIEFQLAEDENSDGLISTNQDEVYKKQFTLNERWHLFSIKYDDFELISGSGNGVKESTKLLKATLVLLSVPAGGQASCNLDFINFTFNKPFSQK